MNQKCIHVVEVLLYFFFIKAPKFIFFYIRKNFIFFSKMLMCFILLLFVSSYVYELTRAALMPSGYFDWSEDLYSRTLRIYFLLLVVLFVSIFPLRRWLRESKVLSVVAVMILWLSFPTIGTWYIDTNESVNSSCYSITIISPILFSIEHGFVFVNHYHKLQNDCGISLQLVPDLVRNNIELILFYLSNVTFFILIAGIQFYFRIFFTIGIFEPGMGRRILIAWIKFAALWLVVLSIVR